MVPFEEEIVEQSSLMSYVSELERKIRLYIARRKERPSETKTFATVLHLSDLCNTVNEFFERASGRTLLLGVVLCES